jgi:hypothetical protein
MLCRTAVGFTRSSTHHTLQTTFLRLKSTSPPLSSFPLQLPKYFQTSPFSVTYDRGQAPHNEDNGQTIPVENPATAQEIQSISCASGSTIDSAINHAHNVFTARTWSRLPLTTRYQTLLKIASLLRESCDSLAARIPAVMTV